MIQLSGFQEAVSLKEEVADLEDELQRVKMNKLHTKSMLRTIFNMGASNETPITASKLLLERNEDNVVNRVRQEIIQIDNYTSLALSYLKLMNQETDMSFSK